MVKVRHTENCDSSVPSGKGALQRGGLSLHHIQVPNRVPAAALGMQDRAHVPKGGTGWCPDHWSSTAPVRDLRGALDSCLQPGLALAFEAFGELTRWMEDSLMLLFPLFTLPFK